MDSLKKPIEKLWNKNFFLLWQGQLVSVLGDVIYIIALDFWVLEMTGSTALMGLLSALTMAPRVIIGPFAGVFVDRWDRKKIIVVTDFIRGIFVTFVGIAALSGFIQVWMVFLVGISNGICSAFFNPAIISSRPDIVPESKLVKANSVTSLAQSSMDMIGNAIGGVLYVTIGAPYMFLFNGISYLFSAFTEMFITIPKVERKNTKITFFEDFKEGFRFLKDFNVLRKMFIYVSLLNFFLNAGGILFVPYFKAMPFLGIERYGFAMTILAMGAMSGSILLSIINLKKENKFSVFKITLITQTLFFICFMLSENYFVILVLMFTAFLCNACLNTVASSAMMSVVPSEIRGKVMAITSTVSMGLTPIGQLIGGVLGEVFPIRMVMIALFSCGLICALVNIRLKNLRNFIEYDSQSDSLEELMKC
ncbi:MFS transporter [Romboutsia sp.]|uniref:MFS transporter n=1 Tax=Romboutsia sp. TaxID=1965302 RepID=UPI003F3B8B48